MRRLFTMLRGAVVFALAALILAPAAFGSGQRDAAAAKQKVELSILSRYSLQEPPKTENEVLKGFEKLSGFTLKFTWVPFPAYADKLRTLIAANTDLPNILFNILLREGLTFDAVKAGVFWEVGPYVSQYPNLAKMNPSVVNNVTHFSKLYSIYSGRDTGRLACYYRKDLADKLGLKQPETEAEMLDWMRGMKRADPDGNGKDDTPVFAFTKNSISWEFLQFFGVPYQWTVTDGKFAPHFDSPQYMEALKFLKTCYQEQLLNQDFTLQTNAMLMQQKVAVVQFGAITENSIQAYVTLKATVPDVRIEFFSRLPRGRYPNYMVPSGDGNAGGFMFPKSANKTEADLKNCLYLMDLLEGREAQNLYQWGILGRHYRLVDGKPQYIDKALYDAEVLDIAWQFRTFITLGYDQGVLDPYAERAYKAVRQENIKYVMPNPAAPLYSQTWARRGADLGQAVYDASALFIMGKLDEKGFRDMLKRDWYDAGGREAADEFGKAYVASK